MKFFKPALLALMLAFFSTGVVANDLSSPTLWDVKIGPQADRPAPEKEKKEVPDSSTKEDSDYYILRLPKNPYNMAEFFKVLSMSIDSNENLSEDQRGRLKSFIFFATVGL